MVQWLTETSNDLPAYLRVGAAWMGPRLFNSRTLLSNAIHQPVRNKCTATTTGGGLVTQSGSSSV